MHSEHEEARAQGGKGGPLRFTRADLVLWRKAARERWGVPDELKTEALLEAARILGDDLTGDRNKLAAAKLLIEADKVDQRDQMIGIAQAKFAHDTAPDEQLEDDYVIDLSPEAEDDPAQSPA